MTALRENKPCRAGNLAAVLALILAVVTGCPAEADEPAPLAASAARIAAERGEVFEHALLVGDTSSRRLPILGITIHRFSFLVAHSEESITVALDEHGTPVDEGLLLKQEAAAHREMYGSLHPSLYRALAEHDEFDEFDEFDEATRLPVVIWLEADVTPPRFRDDYSSIDRDRRRLENGPDDRAAMQATNEERRRAATDWLAQQMPAYQRPVIDWLTERGYPPAYVSRIAPLIQVALPKAAILALADHPTVDTIYLLDPAQACLDTAKVTQKGDIVDSWGFVGSGVDVAIVETEQIIFDNPYLLPGVTHFADAPPSPKPYHASAVAGMVASQHPDYQGVAQGVSLYSGNFGDLGPIEAMEWAAATHSVDVINNSWGTLGDDRTLRAWDRYADYAVRNLWNTFSVAAGNEAGGEVGDTGWVMSPGRAYNVITVGNSHNTQSVTWDDDGMSGSSSFVDPSTGCQKPEVTANGGYHLWGTRHEVPWVADVGSGTSYAAPMVAGLAAQIMSADPALEGYPETVKAIIMATALHNIEGDERLSDKDGVGAIDMRAAVSVANDGVTDWRNVSSGAAYDVFMWADAGERVRAVICWDSNPGPGYTTDPLESWFELWAYQPDGSFLEASQLIYHSYQILDFVAPSSGLYRFNIWATLFTGTQEYIAFAGWSGNNRLDPYAVRTFDTPPVTHDTFRVQTTLGWNAFALRSPATGDFDFRLFEHSAWGDPALHTGDGRVSSTATGPFDLIVVDANHAPTGAYYLDVERYGGGGNYQIEHGTRIDLLYPGTYGPYTMASDQLLSTFDARLFNHTYYYRVVPLTGDADLELRLFDSHPLITSSKYQSGMEAETIVDAGGPGEEELLIWDNLDDQDRFGLVITNKGATTATEFMVYADYTAPFATIVLNGGLPQTGSSRVFVELTSVDGESGIRRVRLRNTGEAWGPWQDPLASLLWDLAPGSGTRTVEFWIENEAGMGSTVSDSIVVYDCPQPAGSLENGGFTDATGFPWCFTDESANGFISYVDGGATVIGGDDGVSAATDTYISQDFTLGSVSFDLNFDWSFFTPNGPAYDWAYWDLVDPGTGASVIGGPVNLSSAGGSAGSVSYPVSGPGSFQLRLGTHSTDNLYGPGYSTFDDVALGFDPCFGFLILSCFYFGGSAQLSWSNGDTYEETRIYRDGTLLATVPPTTTAYNDSSPPPGPRTYTVEPTCSGGTLAPSSVCTIVVPCEPIDNFACAQVGLGAELSWDAGSYESIEVERDGVLLTTLPGGATSHFDATVPIGSHTYAVTGFCSPTSVGATQECSLTISCPSVSAFVCAVDGPDVTISWTIAASYDQIMVRRDGAVVATLGGGASSYSDPGLDPGFYDYEVIAECSGGTASTPTCSVLIEPPICAPLTGLDCLQVDADVELSWFNNDLYTGVEIERDGLLIAFVTDDETNFIDEGVSIGPHTYVATGVCAWGIVVSAPSCIVDVLPLTCDPITSLSCTGLIEEAALSWTNGAAYDSVRIYRDIFLIATLPGSATSYTDSTASVGSHSYDVRGVCPGGTVSSGVVCTVDVLSATCDAPFALNCTGSVGQADLSWTNGADYDSVRIYRDVFLIATLAGTATSYTDSSASVGSHTYDVRGVCPGGVVSSGVVCTVDVPSPTCDPVTALSCGMLGGQVELSWTSGDSYDTVNIYRDLSLIATLPGSATSYLSPAAAGLHTFAVEGVCAGGIASGTAGCFVDVPCDPVIALNCTAVGADVELTWANAEVYASLEIRRDGALLATLPSGAFSYTDFAVPLGPHSYEVQGFCTGGIPAASTPCSVTLSCDPIFGSSCVYSGAGTVELSWSVGDGYEQIDIFRDGLLLTTLGGITTFYSDATASAGPHDYQVQGVCAAGDSTAVGCSVTVPCEPIADLTCESTPAGVEMEWLLGDSYQEIHVYRLGALIATLPGTQTAYLDAAAPVGSWPYTVQGVCSSTELSTMAACFVTVEPGAPEFIRGDCNADGVLQISDVIFGLAALFSGGPAPSCADSCDINDDGGTDISDMVYLLTNLFSGGPDPAAPFPSCGPDPTDGDALGCDDFGSCP